jgi:hypothetical protein
VRRVTKVWRSLLWVAAMAILSGVSAWAAPSGFPPQTRVGHTTGDQWEPALAADGSGHIYILYPQYVTVPGCAHCPVPTMTLVVSTNNGTSWENPRDIAPLGTSQFDAQIVVDPLDRKTVYAAWLQNDKHDVVVAKSVDFGENWAVVLAGRNSGDLDKPVLTVRGRDVFVAYNLASKVWMATSHDGGTTFNIALVNPRTTRGWAQVGGATVDPAGAVYLSWAAYQRGEEHGQGPVDLYVSKSTDGGKNWSSTLLDRSGAPPECATDECGWAYLGAQITIASDSAGTLYALWNAGVTGENNARIYFSSSTTGGSAWSPRADVSRAAAGTIHAFPTIVAGTTGDVRIAWMDTRNAPLWNTYYRNSTNGGATWSPETRLSSYVPGFAYIDPDGFKFPFGDYFSMNIDGRGDTQVVWGEGLTYESPGSIWYTHGR